jgi:hypothetical protein
MPAVTQFHLTSQWTLAAPIGAVWSELTRPEDWPEWWPGIVAVRLLEKGGANGVGAYRRIIWRALPRRLVFNLRTVKIEPRALIEAVADGELTGIGRWQLTRMGAVTAVQHDWIVNVLLPGMPVLDELTGMLFRLNHRSLMARGRGALARRVRLR